MSFTLTALAFFIARKPDDPWTWTRPAGATLLGTLLSLGALCHGGAFLSVPLVVLVVAVSGHDWRPRRSLAGVAMLSLDMAAVSLPWTIYKARHPAIQTQNLIYHYRAVVDRPGNPIPLQAWLENVPLQKQLEIRWTNVVELLSQSEFRATWNAYLGGTLDTFYAARWPKEFFYPMSQVDEMRWLFGGSAAVILLLAVLLAKHTHYHRWPVTRLRPLNAAGVLLLLAVAICSYILNIFAKWTELVPHALPMAEVACVIVSLALLAYGASRWLGHCVLAVVLLRFVHFSITSTIERNQPLFGVFGFAFLAAGALMVWLALSTQETAAEPA